MGEGYLPQMTVSISTFIPVNATYVLDEHHSHGHKHRKCHHLICFFGGWFSAVWGFFGGRGVTCVSPEKYVFLSKVACKVTSGPRVARESLFLLWVFCDLCIEKDRLPAAFTVSSYSLTLQKILNNIISRKILFNSTMSTNAVRAGYMQNNMADNKQIIPEGII